MEIPDSDDDEEILPPTPENKHDNSYREENPTKLRSKTKSTTQLVERILTQLNITGIQNQHQQVQGQEQGRDYAQGNKQNPLSALPPSALSQAKPLLLTLHCLLPNELLPALDILDRGLVKRVVRRRDDDNDEASARAEPEASYLAGESPSNEDIFFVLSVSEHDKKGHEVRLQAWNCTCASFLSSAFPLDPDSDSEIEAEAKVETDHDIDIGSLGGSENYRLGGTLTRGLGQSLPPLCKHILACVLLLRCPEIFKPSSQTWLVSAEELAAWCAGWGD